MDKMDRSWIEQIYLDKIELYPIQFANCDRLVKNDAVYIFDEVGSGKTISSGLMAIDYLYNNPDKKILIITTNSLSRKGTSSLCNQGQFLQDWFDKLPFLELGLDSRIEIVNNHYSNFLSNKLSNKEYGLVIIDEAHLFGNEKSRRCIELENNITAEKVVFLTATPIKNNEYNLYTYRRIAKAITKKELPIDWIEKISTDTSEKELICSLFDPSLPVTRYFKDTIMALNFKGFKKIKAKRLLSEVWKYDIHSESKLDALLKNIKEVLKNDEKSKFVIFVKYVTDEAETIENYLCKDEDFLYYDDYDMTTSSEKKWTVKVVTGKNANELAKFKGHDNLPTVLVLTYQIAEQGVNLPGFNYVVNFNIPAFPSSLEQRFGRIDRMGKNGSQFDEIHMCFLIRKNNCDTDTWNFYQAVHTYLHHLISCLPSKNSLLSKEIIDLYGQSKLLIDEHIQNIENLLLNPEEMNHIKEYFQQLKENEEDPIEYKENEILLEFINENEIEYDIDSKCAEENFKKEVRDKLSKLKKDFEELEKKEKEENIFIDSKNIIEKAGDKIFYFEDCFYDKSLEKLHTVDAVENCAKCIQQNSIFKDYEENFKKEIKLPLLLLKYPTHMKYFNQYFENEFMENRMENIFPMQGYENILCKLFENQITQNISDEDKKEIIQNADYIVQNLPFFRMCRLFKMLLKSCVYNKDGSIRYRFDFNPFTKSFERLGYKIFESIDFLGLSESFVKNNWKIDENLGIITENINNLFVITQNDKNGIISASNWYKLSYHYLRKEEACFINLFLREQEELNYFYNLEKSLKEISKDNNKSFDVRDVINNRPEKWQSLFNHYIYTEGGSKRQEIYLPKNNYQNPKIPFTDIWTRGIYFELFNINIDDCKWGDILSLPKEYKDIPLFDKNGKVY